MGILQLGGRKQYGQHENKTDSDQCPDSGHYDPCIDYDVTVKPLTFRMEKSANYPYHLLRMIYSFYIYAGTASFGGSHPNAFNFFKYAWIFRSALN